MNRSILIVICDFLLVNLLVFSSMDIDNISSSGGEPTANLAPSTNQVDPRQDLNNVMRVALEQEKRNQDILADELKQAREISEQRQHLLTEQETQLSQARQSGQTLAATLEEQRKNAEKLTNQLAQSQAVLNEREKQLTAAHQASQELETQLQQTRQEATQNSNRLTQLDARVQVYKEEMQSRDKQVAQLTAKQDDLAKQIADAQAAYQSAQSGLRFQQSNSVDSIVAKERLAALESEARKRLEQATNLQQQLAQLQQSNKLMQAEQQSLTTQLRVAEAEKKAAASHAASLDDAIKAERQEKERLSHNIESLSKSSGQLAEEIRNNRPLAPNTVFSELVSNRISTQFKATRSTLFGIDSTRTRQTQTILVTDGKATFAMCHVQETPLVFSDPGLDWETLDGTLVREQASLPIRFLSFHRLDPRLVLIPLTDSEAKELHCRVYHTSADPFRFSDAVVVGAKEGYYGECKFQIDLSTPGYVKMDRNSLIGLFGKFNPSTGDLVFSKNGEILGVMANSSYCMVLKDFGTSTTLRFGAGDQHTGLTLAQYHTFIAGLSFKLQ